MEASEAITDRAVSRELFIKGQVNRITKQLTDLELALVEDLAKALARLSTKDETRLLEGNYTTTRLKALIAQVRQFSEDWANIVRKQLNEGGLDLIEAELEFERMFLAAQAETAGVSFALGEVITPRQVFTAAKRRPFATKVLKEAFPTMKRNVKAQIVDSLRISYQAGETIGQATTRLRSNEHLAKNKRGAAGLARTVLNGYSSSATMDSLRALNVPYVQFLATLDSRTTLSCVNLDKKVWAIGSSRIRQPPIHFNCRSALVGTFDKEGFSDGQRASRGEEGGKPVSAALSYEDWFARRSKTFQREFLGPTRYKIWQKTGDLGKFTDKYSTRVYSVTELKQRYSSYFTDGAKLAA